MNFRFKKCKTKFARTDFRKRNLSDRFTFHIEHKHPRRNQATRDIGSLGARFNWIREAANNILPLIDTFASEHEVPITAPKCLFLGKNKDSPLTVLLKR